MPKCWILLAGLLAIVPFASAGKKEKVEKSGPTQRLVADGEAADEKIGISAHARRGLHCRGGDGHPER